MVYFCPFYHQIPFIDKNIASIYLFFYSFYSPKSPTQFVVRLAPEPKLQLKLLTC